MQSGLGVTADAEVGRRTAGPLTISMSTLAGVATSGMRRSFAASSSPKD